MSNHVVLFAQPWESWRLAVGTFLTSPGAGVLGLLGSAYLAFKGANKRITADRELAATSRKEEHKRDLDSERGNDGSLSMTTCGPTATCCPLRH